LIEGCAGFADHQMGVGGIGHKIQSPAGVFTAELSALFTALRHIAEVIRPPERCLILTDSLSSIKAMFYIKIATLRILVDAPILLLYDTSALI
jgi:ribonuclease HI